MAGAPVLEIRESAVALQEHAIRLRDAVKADYFKRRLSDAISDLDEIDSFVLPHVEKADESGSEAKWLRAAHLRLHMAGSVIGTVQDAVDTYGYDADVTGGD